MAVIDRTANNTGYWERSQRNYKKDYADAQRRFDDWFSRGMPWDARPLFKEVREGHRAVMDRHGLLRKHDCDDFLRTKEHQRAEWRRRYHEEQGHIPKRPKRDGIQKDLKDLLERSVEDMICFGCGKIIEGKYINPDRPAPQLKVHPTKECKEWASKRYQMLVRG